MAKQPKHFLSLFDLSPQELNKIIDDAIALKKAPINDSFKGKVLAMIFDKSSTRTRVSFEAGMAQLGGHAIFLSPKDTQLGRGEPIEDSARVISSMVDMVMIRTFAHESIERFAEYSSVPVINALTDSYHPCQLLADIMTYREHRGEIKGKTVAWVGDGNNMCHSYINAAKQFDFTLKIACPEGFKPTMSADLVSEQHVVFCNSPEEAVTDSDLVVTDTWISMGQEEEKQQRVATFEGYEVNHSLMANANKDALFMHCLPAYRGYEVSSELIEDPQYSVVWDEAENRLHAQKALMLFLSNLS